MNIEHLRSTIEEVAQRLYPDVPEVAKLCQAIIIWERDYASVTTPRYKGPYMNLLKDVEKRWQERLALEKQGEQK
jgi:hypothetical protein